MLRLFSVILAHRTMVRAMFLGIAVVAMALSFSGVAAAEDGLDP